MRKAHGLALILKPVPNVSALLADFLLFGKGQRLASRLPPKRRPWENEDGRMDIFDAVALALVFRLSQVKRMQF
jgi:hypothetical protein